MSIMYDPLILMPYAGRDEPLSFQRLEGNLPGVRIKPIDVSDHPYRYWEVVKQYWGYPTDLVIIEHDMVVEPRHVTDLLSCKSNLCSQAYKRSGELYYCHNTAVDPFSTVHGGKWLDVPKETTNHSVAKFSGLGCCKLGSGARRGTWVRLAKFMVLDQSVSRALQTGQWDIHWPGVGHDHSLSGIIPRGATPEWYKTTIKERGLQRL